MGISERFARVAEELAQVCESCGRDPGSVLLIGVSKTVGIVEVGDAIAAGACDFGENRPDQLMLKHDAFPQANWHFIGHIQSRRIKDVVGRATLVHSLYKFDHARKIAEAAHAQGIIQDVLLEVNVSGEESKDGIEPDRAEALLAECLELQGIRVRGLMTMAPQGDPLAAHSTFEGLYDLRERLRAQLDDASRGYFTELSMGMSEDWREAVAAGSTMVRIGRALFSESF